MTNCAIHSEKDDVFLFALFSAHLFKQTHILMTQESIPHQIYDSSWNLCRVQNKQLHSWRITAPPFTQPYTTTVNPAAAGGEIVNELSTFTEVQFKVLVLWMQLLSPSCHWFESFSCFLSANIRSQDHYVHLSATRVGPAFVSSSHEEMLHCGYKHMDTVSSSSGGLWCLNDAQLRRPRVSVTHPRRALL